MPTRLRWAIFSNLLTVGLAGVFWLLLRGTGRPLVVSGHIAAALGLCWAVIVWAARWRFNERNRLTATHPCIVVGQFMCLAACLYAVLINTYFVVPQFATAVVHTYSYTILLPQQWIYSDISGLADLLCVVAVCFIITHSTQSGYLMVPLFWVFFITLMWECLLIPPVLPEYGILSTGLTGIPSLWVLALLLGNAFLVSVFVALQWISWKTSRRKAWRLDVTYLLRPPRSWPGLESSVAAVGMFVLLLGCALLVFPAPAGLFRAMVSSVACAVAAGITGIGVFAVVQRHWAVSLGELAFALFTLSICSIFLIFVPHEPPQLAARFPLIFNALVFGCATCTALWWWLSEVWQQQLNDGIPWTTAGRLIPVAQRSSFIAGVFGVLFSLHMAAWPLLAQARYEDNSLGRILCGVGGIALLGMALIWSYHRTQLPAYRSLILLNGFSVLLFGFVRILPFTTLSY